MSKKKNQTKLIDIAKAAGVDVSTVSLCLNDSPKAAEKTKKRIKELAAKMNYYPNMIAKGLRSGKSNTIGLLIPSLDMPFFVEMLKGMENHLFKKNYTSLLSVIRENEYSRIFNEMTQRNVDGLCLGFISYQPYACEIYRDFLATGKPAAFYIEKDILPTLEGVDANFAICDMSIGTNMIMNHLYSLNHRRIATVGYVKSRVKDYSKFLMDHDIIADPQLIISEVYQDGAWKKQLLELMKSKNPPTAIFAHNDSLAISISKLLMDNGYRIPEDVSLAGINNTPLTDMLKVPLTTLSLPTQEIGASLAEMVLEQLSSASSKPQKRYFDMELIVRDSTSECKG